MKKIALAALLWLCFASTNSFAVFFVQTPKATEIFRPGQNVYISWSRQEYPEILGVHNYADYYLVEVRGLTTTGTISNWFFWTEDNQFGAGPDRWCNYTVPCNAVGVYTIQITAFDRSVFGSVVTTVGTFNVLELNAPLPIVKVKCSKQPEVIEIPNPQEYDRMDLYASINSNTPFAQIPASGKMFYYTDTSTTTNAFFARFIANTYGSCPPLLSPATPMAVIVLPDGIKQVIKDSVDIVDYMDDSCSRPLSYYDLDIGVSDPLGEIIKNAINALMDSTLDIVDVSEAKVEFTWEDQNYITHVFDTLPGGAIVQHQRVCASDDLPDDPGSCRTYELRAVVHAKAYLKNASGDIVSAPDIHCNLGKIRETKVCKKMIAPPNDVILLCKSGVQAATMINYYGYTDLEWFALQEFETPVNTGYSYTQDWNWKKNQNYNYKIRHVASNGRKGPFGLVKVVVLPPYSTDFVEVLVNKPATQPDNCEELGTYYDLELTQDVKEKKIAQFINLTDLKTTADLNLEMSTQWMDTAYITEKPGILGTEERACYKKLPTEGGSCRLYWKNGTAEVKVDMTNPLDPLGAKLSHTERCDDIRLIDVNVCKAMYPPKPEVFVLCKEGPGTVTLDPNQDQYADVLWYKTTDPDVVDHHGRTYFRSDWGQKAGVDDNIQTFFVENVSSSGRKSARSVVQVIILPSTATTADQAVITKPLLTSENDLPGYCTSLPNEISSYYDLGYDPAAYVQQVNSLVQFINDNNTIFHTNAIANVNVRWENQDSISHPDYEPSIQRVCFGNLPEGEETCQEYRCFLDVHYTFRMDPNAFPQVPPQNEIVTEGGTCPIPVRTVTVCKSPFDPQEGDKCRPDPPNATVLLAYTDCGSRELLVACPNKEYLLQEPVSATYTGYTTSYQWTEPANATGSLDSYNKSYTMLNASVPPKAFYLKYKLTKTYTPVPATPPNPPRPDEIHCVMVYVCEQDCSDGSRISSSGQPESQAPVIIDGTKASIVNLFPDPAGDELNVVYNLPEGEQGELVVSNLLGQVIERVKLETEDIQTKLNLTNYQQGTYICTMLTENGTVSTTRFTVIK